MLSLPQNPAPSTGGSRSVNEASISDLVKSKTTGGKRRRGSDSSLEPGSKRMPIDLISEHGDSTAAKRSEEGSIDKERDEFERMMGVANSFTAELKDGLPVLDSKGSRTDLNRFPAPTLSSVRSAAKSDREGEQNIDESNGDEGTVGGAGSSEPVVEKEQPYPFPEGHSGAICSTCFEGKSYELKGSREYERRNVVGQRESCAFGTTCLRDPMQNKDGTVVAGERRRPLIVGRPAYFPKQV